MRPLKRARPSPSAKRAPKKTKWELLNRGCADPRSCPDCKGSGYLDDAGFCMDPCSHPKIQYVVAAWQHPSWEKPKTWNLIRKHVEKHHERLIKAARHAGWDELPQLVGIYTYHRVKPEYFGEA